MSSITNILHDDDDYYVSEKECVICIETTPEICMTHAHPKAHAEAHTQASEKAERMALKEAAEDYIDYYIFSYGREYKKLYNTLYKKHREEYYDSVLNSPHPHGKICSYHQDSLYYAEEYTPERIASLANGYSDSPDSQMRCDRHIGFGTAHLTGPVDCDGTPVSRF